MNKTLIIINREFSTRVRKKTFLIVTIFVPVLFALFYAFLMWMLLKDDRQERTIAVVNHSSLNIPFQQINNTRFHYIDQDIPENEYANYLKKNNYYAITIVPSDIVDQVELPIFSLSQIPIELKNELASQLQKKNRGPQAFGSHCPKSDSRFGTTISSHSNTCLCKNARGVGNR